MHAVDAITNLRSDATPDESLRPCDGAHVEVAAARQILLTGTTGLVGAFLLKELLAETHADVICLVRADGVGKAYERIRAVMDRHQIWTPGCDARIVPVVGDLSMPLLGLSAAQFDEIAATADVVFHAGATVNFMQPYSMLRAANVGGTREVIRLAGRHKKKAVHYVSSISVFSETTSTAPPGLKEIHESDTPSEISKSPSGYSPSKWAAETLVAGTGAWGLPFAIYRPATILGHTRTGITTHVGCMLLRAWLAVGAVPSELRDLNLISVDYVSQAIVHLSKQPESIGKAFHLVNPVKTPFRDIFEMFRAHGHPLEEVSNEQLRQRLAARIAVTRDPDLLALLLTANELEKQLRPRPVRIRFRNDEAARALAGTSIECPPIDRPMLDTFYSVLAESGMLAVR
jgi:thioester reductase-like protein